MPNLRRRYDHGTWTEQADLEPYRSLRPCPGCQGQRLKAQSLSVKVKGRTIADYVDLPISEALTVFDSLHLTDREVIIAERVLREIQDRLRFLNDVGVGYLTLGRSAATLSGGEGQRIRLATQIGANLTGVLYVLDEPSIGLHQRDNRKLLSTLCAASRSGQHRHRGRARRGDDSDGRLRDRSRARCGRAWRARHLSGNSWRARRAGHGIRRHGRKPDRDVPGRRAQHSDAEGEAARYEGRPRHQGRAREQPEEHRRAHPAGSADGCDRRQRLGEVHARQRHPVQVARPIALQGRRTSQARTIASRASDSSTRSSKSISRRSGGRRARIRRPTPASSPSSAISSR